MKNNLKMNLSLVALTTLLAFTPLNVSLANDSSESESGNVMLVSETEHSIPLEEDVVTEYGSEDFSVMYIPYDGKEYTQTKKESYNSINYTHEYRNNSSTSDSLTITKNRTRFSNGSVGASGEASANFKLVTAKAGVSAEKAWGTSDSVSVSQTFNFAPKTKNVVKIGSKAVRSKGQIKEYRNGSLVKTTNVDTKWSTRSYTNKDETKLK
ncbi:hypothetical protein P4641_16415 [Halalkalibacterium halodurans]|uniref:hypothetical protein n=1 Tax=Halalkalibacterium halodurans TaxID=86665 RepID=UPI002E23C140|nr:hypothetical protein [Halalkalibacterium halodurans]